MTKRSMHSPLKERTVHRLKDCPKKGVRKVALEPGCRNGWKPGVSVHGLSPLADKAFDFPECCFAAEKPGRFQRLLSEK